MGLHRATGREESVAEAQEATDPRLPVSVDRARLTRLFPVPFNAQDRGIVNGAACVAGSDAARDGADGHVADCQILHQHDLQKVSTNVTADVICMNDTDKVEILMNLDDHLHIAMIGLAEVIHLTASRRGKPRIDAGDKRILSASLTLSRLAHASRIEVLSLREARSPERSGTFSPAALPAAC